MLLTNLQYPLARSIGAVLSLLLLMGGMPAAAETLTIGGTGAALATVRLLGEAAAEDRPALSIEVLPSLGSSGGIRALQDGQIDLAVSSRPLTDAERESGLRAIHLADTPIAFVSSQSADRDLSASEVIALYASPDSRWSDGAQVRVILRPEGESQYRYLQDQIPGFMEAVAAAYRRPEIPIAPTDQENVSLARQIEGSLTAVTLAQLLTEAPELTVLSLNGVQPSPANLVDGRYPLMTRFFLVVSLPTADPVQRFLDFVQSPEAASVLSQFGQVPAQHSAGSR